MKIGKIENVAVVKALHFFTAVCISEKKWLTLSFKVNYTSSRPTRTSANGRLTRR